MIQNDIHGVGTFEIVHPKRPGFSTSSASNATFLAISKWTFFVKNLESIYFRHCLSIFWAFFWQHFTWATPSFSIPFDARQGDVEKAAEKLSQADRCNSDSRGGRAQEQLIPLNYPVGWYVYKTCMIICLNRFKMINNIRVLRVLIYICIITHTHIYIYTHVYIYMCVCMCLCICICVYNMKLFYIKKW